jgi:hypothetical protein
MPMNGLLLSDDLIDTSRITGTARALGLTIRAIRSLEQLRELLRQEPSTCVFVDLHYPGLEVASVRTSSCARVVAYGSHVDTARLKVARAAGCDVVLPRSAFFEKLPTSLAAWLNPSDLEPLDESVLEDDREASGS